MTTVERNRSLIEKFIPWYTHTRPSEHSQLLMISVGVGAIIGLVIVLFRVAFGVAYQWTYSELAPQVARIHPLLVALLVPAGGVIVGLLMHFVIGKERHPGVSGVMEAVALTGGRLDYWQIPAKLVAAVVSIACGASVGPEDPSVQIGAGIGSAAGQWLKLSGEHTALLAAAGVGAGIAAVFNAPIAGMFFSLEIIMVGTFTTSAFSVVVITSVVAAIISQLFLGAQPAFTVPAYELRSPWEILLYAGLGVLAAPVAALFIKTFHGTRDWFLEWDAPAWLKPVAAGVLVGLAGIALPRILGVGYEYVGDVLTGHFLAPIPLLLALLAVKMLATNLSVGSGYMGGAFAPALFLGAMLGQAYGLAMKSLLPGFTAAPEAYAMVGMAAVLAGSVHAPLTAILLLFEMTRDYRIILPVMLAVSVALVVSEQLQRDSFYMLSLRRHGIHVERNRDIDLMQGVKVGQAMTRDVDTVPATLSANALASWFTTTHHHGAPVVDEHNRMVGMVTLSDLDRARAKGSIESLTVNNICTHDVLTAYPDESLWDALQRLGTRDIGRLPVLSRESPGRLVGLIRRQDIIRAYNAAIAEKITLQHRAEEVRLGAITGTDVHEVVIPANSPVVEKTLAEIHWPEDTLVASIRRGRRVILPRGSTRLAANDTLVVVSRDGAEEGLEDLLKSPTDNHRRMIRENPPNQHQRETV